MLQLSRLFVLVLVFANSIRLFAEDESKHEAKEAAETFSFERDELDNSAYSLIKEEGEEKPFRAFFKTGLGYSTNPFLIPNLAQRDPGSFVYRFRPALGFEAGNKYAKFDWGTAIEGQLVFFDSQQPHFMLLNSNVFIHGELLPENPVTIQVEGMVEETREVEDLFMDSLTQLIATFRGGVKIHEGPFTMRVNGEVKNRSYFDVDQPDAGKFTGDPEAFNDKTFSFTARAEWQFSKNFAVFADGKYGAWYGRDEQAIVTNNPIWVNAGVRGLLAPNLQFKISGGYADSFVYSKTTNVLIPDGSVPVAAEAELNWIISKNSSLYIDVSRSMHMRSLFLNDYDTGAMIDFRHRFMKDFTLSVSPSFRAYEYAKPLNDAGTALVDGSPRTDFVLGMREEIMYFVTNWFSVGFSHRGQYRWTNAADFQIFGEDGWVADPSNSPPSANTQNEFMINTSLYY